MILLPLYFGSSSPYQAHVYQGVMRERPEHERVLRRSSRHWNPGGTVGCHPLKSTMLSAERRASAALTHRDTLETPHVANNSTDSVHSHTVTSNHLAAITSATPRKMCNITYHNIYRWFCLPADAFLRWALKAAGTDPKNDVKLCRWAT